MRIAVIGAFGQLGSDLVPLLGDRAIPLGHADVEITDPVSIAKALDAARPTHVINCAAYNLVDKAEDEPGAAHRVNSLGPRNLAEWCAARGAVLMHVSTDYVFGADRTRQTPLGETDPTGPVSVYGQSKLEGELAVRSLCPQHFLVRTCGLYGHRAARGKGNFVETMLRLSRERPELRIVGDQRCTPTSTADLARALVSLIETDAFGLYHATNAGDCSWFEFACEIFRLASITVKTTPMTAAEYGAKARRPDYSVLDCSKLANVLGRPMPPWQESLAKYLADRPA
ncbi:MAG: dTDP-4-dehydrorhamnose reductase [Candidatus Saccharimonas sp.]|nr:dTDP-4-dehydrorhamnose reductase [Planctomycetaceae bacterium]